MREKNVDDEETEKSAWTLGRLWNSERLMEDERDDNCGETVTI